jgi:type II secretory ATPase GspE/PulE/Tfp pilus assembly ATPase PilB-like protein
MKYGSKIIEYRVAICPTVGGNEDAVLRILAASEPIPLEKMMLSPRNLELIKANVETPYGLILTVGPTGSGKTTMLHSCLGHINTPERKIWTAEDPVEITQDGLRQVQMHSKIGLDFARTMRSFLRGDPDVIMVGEMRDPETAAIGLEASLTGHLVFSTLHTNSAPETIVRLLDMGMNPLNFADALLLVVAQRLVRTLCGECKEKYQPSKEEFQTLVTQYGEEEFKAQGIKYKGDLKLCKSKGCDKCGDTGYAGRIALHEVLEGTQELKRLILTKALVNELRTQAIKDGMTTLKQDGISKIFQGHTDLKQVLAVCSM